MSSDMNMEVIVRVKKSDAHALLRALALANKHAHRQAARARRNTSSTVAGWVMEAADYSQLHSAVKQAIKEAK